jgi:hypothetical protein
MANLTFLIASLMAMDSLAQNPSPSPTPPQRRSLELELEEVPNSSGYEVEVTRIVDGKPNGKGKIFKLESTSWNAQLLPGRYQMKTRSIDRRGVPGEWTDPKLFTVKLFAPTIKNPPENSHFQSADEKDL